MLQPRKLLLTATLAVCGVVYAATPLMQGPVQPTEHHERVMKGVGHWKGTMTMSMPGMPESTSDCSETVTALGGLWTQSQFRTNFMGMEFQGSATLGYDPKKGKFVGTWIDNMNPMLTVMEGVYDKEKNAIVMEYEMMDEMTGEMKPVRSYTVTTADTYTMAFYDVKDGNETKTMEMNMKRQPVATEAAAGK